MSYPGVSTQPSPGAVAQSGGGKPVPDQNDPLSAPFWAAANEGKLVLQRCGGCARFHHPPVGICPDCLSTDFSFPELSGRGEVYSFVIVRDQRLVSFDKLLPYLAASIRLEEAPEITLASNLPGTAIDEARIGLKVRVAFEEIAPGIRIPQFRASEETP